MQQIVKYDVNPSLLLLDWLGYPALDNREAGLLFQVVAARYESGSIVLTTNCRFLDVGTIIDINSTLATRRSTGWCTIERRTFYKEPAIARTTKLTTQSNSA